MLRTSFSGHVSCHCPEYDTGRKRPAKSHYYRTTVAASDEQQQVASPEANEKPRKIRTVNAQDDFVFLSVLSLCKPQEYVPNETRVATILFYAYQLIAVDRVTCDVPYVCIWSKTGEIQNNVHTLSSCTKSSYNLPFFFVRRSSTSAIIVIIPIVARFSVALQRAPYNFYFHLCERNECQRDSCIGFTRCLTREGWEVPIPYFFENMLARPFWFSDLLYSTRTSVRNLFLFISCVPLRFPPPPSRTRVLLPKTYRFTPKNNNHMSFINSIRTFKSIASNKWSSTFYNKKHSWLTINIRDTVARTLSCYTDIV